ncbi:MAG: S1 RNA-binding domain-containing protein [Erysipelotrichaceae bacterium]|nr:S1 RNA-binding domain-containing protein [Erysipelotrichaceae bacterium]
MEQIKAGDVIEVTITGIQPYGAFALLPDNTSGLIHISEISDRFVRNISSYVQLGNTARVKVLEIDPETHQAKLSLKAIRKEPKRKYYRSYRSNRHPIVETPKGFQPLKDMLPVWIENGINMGDDI